MIHALHGNLGSASDWDPLGLPEIVAHDLWGHLESRPKLNLEVWGAGFSRGVALETSDPLLLGYSMGGRLALHAILSAPEKWKGAVIVVSFNARCASANAICALDNKRTA